MPSGFLPGQKAKITTRSSRAGVEGEQNPRAASSKNGKRKILMSFFFSLFFLLGAFFFFFDPRMRMEKEDCGVDAVVA